MLAWLILGIAESVWRIGQTGDGEVGDAIRDLSRRLRAFGTEPVRGPVERAEEGARRDGGIGGGERATTNAIGDERAHAALIAVPFGDDARAETGRERVHFEVGGRPFNLVEQAQDVGHGQVVQPIGQRPSVASSGGEGREEAAERPILAEEEQLVLAAKVVVEVARRQVRRDRDVAHPRGGEPAVAKQAGRGFEDVDAARVGAS